MSTGAIGCPLGIALDCRDDGFLPAVALGKLMLHLLSLLAIVSRLLGMSEDRIGRCNSHRSWCR